VALEDHDLCRQCWRARMDAHSATRLARRAEETAAETGHSERQVRFRLRQMRDRFAQRLVVLGLREC
jgi:hypothetical protein